jgi:hypothetical protein
MNYVAQLQPNANTLDMATHFENDGVNPYMTGLSWNGLSCVK